jgi:hypothetical protein
MPPLDRLETMLAAPDATAVTGIDFVFVHPGQTTLDVFFLRPPDDLAVPLVNDVLASQIRIASPSAGEVPVTGVAWTVADGRDVLRLTTAFPGGFSLYRLHIDDPRIDPYFNDVAFSFKANCPSELDCQAGPHECPPEAAVDFPVDYLARDFNSFRRALLDFASERYPDWEDRLEADVGVMLAEVMSAIGDELAYYQDRVGREAYLETASQRRSLRRHARLVDYELHDGAGATTWLDVTVKPGAAGILAAGAQVWERGPNPDEPAPLERRRQSRVVYEVGTGLRGSGGFGVAAVRNQFTPHVWDEDDRCLPVGATTLDISGPHAADIPFDDFPPGGTPGKWVLLQTTPLDPAVPARTHVVRLIAVVDMHDPVFTVDFTRLTWEAEQSTVAELDLDTLVVRANLVPATAGRTEQHRFVIGPPVATSDPEEALERAGPDGTVAYLSSIPGSNETGVVWRPGTDGDGARREPEIRLFEMIRIAGTLLRGPEWVWQRSLVKDSSLPGDAHFTLDDGLWRRLVGYRRMGRVIEHRDYASGDGTTVRFGDNRFGRIPAPGTIFEAIYRLGNGRIGNVPARSLEDFDPTTLPFVAAVTNPIAATDGIDPETPSEIRQQAPDAFRAVTFRAVRPEDYARAAERGLPWIQRAGCAFRWTGSWLTAFVTPDPRNAVGVAEARRLELLRLLDRVRQAGRDVHALPPRYADLDLVIGICVAPEAHKGEVKGLVLEALFGRRGMRPRPGFFSPDNFTFGTPLERSSLEAAIQSVDGVRAVEGIRIRHRGAFDWRPFAELTLAVAHDQVIRVENDPHLPERGSVRLVLEGGA